MTTPSFSIKKREIGPGQPVYIIAELSGNHVQSFEQAVAMIQAAKNCGADAIKLQTYTADTLTIQCDRKCFQVGEGTLWEGRSLYDLYAEAYTPWEWQPSLKKIANDHGLDLFSSPFDETAVEFLEKMDVPAYKIASFELIDIPLIKKVAAKGKPVILSTGMATEEEISEALSAIRSVSPSCPVALLKCTSAYPAAPEEMNLQTLADMRRRFDVVVGLSDHTLGTTVPIAAVALGASIIEKHFVLDRSLKGPDSAFSLEPQEFKAMVDAVRVTEKALGRICYNVSEKESKSRVFRRSLFVVEAIKKGEIFTEKNLRSIRPGDGLPPKYFTDILGKKSTQDIARGTPLAWEMVGG